MIGMFNRIFKGSQSRVQGLKINRIEAILALLVAFRQYGRKEVSLSEFQVAVAGLQNILPLKYSFSKVFLYSYQLFEDLQTLEYEGDVVEFQYRHDAFLPKSFLELTPTGLVHGQEILDALFEKDRVALENSVVKATEHYRRTWRLWSRATIDV
jgi:hypothetical protein